MSSNEVWTPRLKFEEVSEKVEAIRSSFEALQQIPVDIEAFLEFELGIDIVPYNNLKSLVGAEAMISQDYTIVYVDRDAYMDDKSWTRLKFSIAHELGHMYLHKDFFAKQHIKTEDDWVGFMLDVQVKYLYLEHHANWFAGILLVPAAELIKCMTAANRPSIPELTRHFEVSQKVIEKRILAPDMVETVNALLSHDD